MAPLPRDALPGQPQHVNQRGNNRAAVFAADADYQFLWDCLKYACDQHPRCHAHVFMTNHVHFLMAPENEEGIGKVMQPTRNRAGEEFFLILAAVVL